MLLADLYNLEDCYKEITTTDKLRLPRAARETGIIRRLEKLCEERIESLKLCEHFSIKFFGQDNIFRPSIDYYCDECKTNHRTVFKTFLQYTSGDGCRTEKLYSTTRRKRTRTDSNDGRVTGALSQRYKDQLQAYDDLLRKYNELMKAYISICAVQASLGTNSE
jgi:hypothetical protein